ncbi:MAG: hypothetical protein ABJA87_08075 [bacterium]
MLDADGVVRVRDALSGNYCTLDGVGRLLGPAASAALARGDRCAAALAVGNDHLSVLVRLFLLCVPVPPAAAAAALAPLSPDDAAAAGLVW